MSRIPFGSFAVDGNDDNIEEPDNMMWYMTFRDPLGSTAVFKLSIIPPVGMEIPTRLRHVMTCRRQFDPLQIREFILAFLPEYFEDIPYRVNTKRLWKKHESLSMTQHFRNLGFPITHFSMHVYEIDNNGRRKHHLTLDPRGWKPNSNSFCRNLL